MEQPKLSKSVNDIMQQNFREDDVIAIIPVTVQGYIDILRIITCNLEKFFIQFSAINTIANFRPEMMLRTLFQLYISLGFHFPKK